MTLVELMVASGIGGMVFAVVASLVFFSSRSFAALTNYVDLDQYSRNALDQMISEIRQADGVTRFTTNELDCRFTNPTNGVAYTTTYKWDSTSKQLKKSVAGGTPQVLLQECDTLKFACYQRNPQNGKYDWYPVENSRPDLVKLVEMNWICSRSILGKNANTESVQSAKVVIRKQ